MIAANLITLKKLGSQKDNQKLLYITKNWKNRNIATGHWRYYLQENFLEHAITESKIYFFDLDRNPDAIRGYRFNQCIVEETDLTEQDVNNIVIPSMLEMT